MYSRVRQRPQPRGGGVPHTERAAEQRYGAGGYHQPRRGRMSEGSRRAGQGRSRRERIEGGLGEVTVHAGGDEFASRVPGASPVLRRCLRSNRVAAGDVADCRRVRVF